MSKRNKIRNIFLQSQKNKNDLYKLKFKSESINNISNFKTPKLLYDSGWVDVGVEDENGNVQGNPYIWLNRIIIAVHSENTIIPFQLNYSFKQAIDISEQYLPHVDYSILIKDHPNIINFGGNEKIIYYYDTSTKHTEIYAKNQLVFRGEAINRYYTYSELSSFYIPTTHVGKIFNVKMEYYQNSELREIQGNLITDVEEKTDIRDYEEKIIGYRIKTITAIDNISGLTITGAGTDITVINDITTNYQETILSINLSEIGTPDKYFTVFGITFPPSTLVSFTSNFVNLYRAYLTNKRLQHLYFYEDGRLATWGIGDNLVQLMNPPNLVTFFEYPWPRFYTGGTNCLTWGKINNSRFILCLNGKIGGEAKSTTTVTPYSYTKTSWYPVYEVSTINTTIPAYIADINNLQIRFLISFNNLKNYQTINDKTI